MIAKSKKKSDPDRQGLAYGYARVSTDRQAKDGIGLDAQDKIIQDYYDRDVKPRNIVWAPDHTPEWTPGMFVDPISATKKLFSQRYEGGRLLRLLKPGDHLIVAKHDRAFRDTFDFAVTFRDLEDNGIFLHVVNLRFDSSNREAIVFGKAMLGMSVVFAELESGMMSQRQKDINAIRRTRSLTHGGRVPIGFKLVGPKGQRKLVPNEEERKVMRWIVKQHDEHGATFFQISRALVEDSVMWKKQDKKAPSGYTLEFWTDIRVKRGYYRMKEIEAAEARGETGATNGS